MELEGKRYYHKPVLLEKFLEICSPIEGTWVDCTLGGGGYTKGLISKGAEKVICIDRDPEMIFHARPLKKKFGEKVQLVNDRFSNIQKIIKVFDLEMVDGVVLDIGMSSFQLENPRRGFSFRKDGPLDMRMSKNGFSAFDIINNAKQKSLEEIIFFYGEEKNAKLISKNIVKERQKKIISSTFELKKIIEKSIFNPKRMRKKNPFAKTFQALRIAVNEELIELKKVLLSIEKILRFEGKFAVVSFHSLEDKIVKEFLLKRSKNFQNNRYLPQRDDVRLSLKNLTKKVITPSKEEIIENPKSSSAKMRVAKKILDKIEYKDDFEKNTFFEIKIEWNEL